MQRCTFPLLPALFLFTAVLVAGCGDPAADSERAQANSEFNCAPANGGITLPDGFCATLVADSVGRARHLDVAPNGEIYLKTRSEAGGIAALRDTTGDYRADVIERFSDMTEPGEGILWETGMAVHDNYIWASNTEAVYRWPKPEDGALVPDGDPEIVVSGFPEQDPHDSKSIAFDESGNLDVNVGAPSNACQEDSRTPGSPGLDSCPQLERHAGIWRFDADELGQTQQGGTAHSISPTPKKAGSGAWYTPGTRMMERPARSKPENQ